MKMKNDDLQLDDGLVAFNVNGKLTLTINPTDADFFRKVADTFDTLAKRQSSMAQETKGLKGSAVFDFMERINLEIRESIDSTLGPYCDHPDVCATLFDTMYITALSNGLPVWANLLFAIMEKADESIAREKGLTSAAIQKYTAKYHR